MTTFLCGKFFYVNISLETLSKLLLPLFCDLCLQIYSSGNPSNSPNPVKDVRASIEVKTAGGIFRIYQTGLCHNQALPDSSLCTLGQYDSRDVQVICCEPDGASLWLIPPGTLQSLISSIHAEDLEFSSQWEFARDRPKEKEIAHYSYPWNSKEQNIFVADQLKGVLNGTLNSVYITNLYPRYFRVPGSGDVRQLEVCTVSIFLVVLLQWYVYEKMTCLCYDFVLLPSTQILYRAINILSSFHSSTIKF